jgi:hypothetical protein
MADAISALECRNRATESWRSAGILFREPRLEMRALVIAAVQG